MDGVPVIGAAVRREPAPLSNEVENHQLVNEKHGSIQSRLVRTSTRPNLHEPWHCSCELTMWLRLSPPNA